jgi:cytochrome c-type biogenesis protein
MELLSIPVASAFWLGLLTSVSPCPLATNITAVSFFASRLKNPAKVLVAGLLYTAGRAAAYTALSAVLVSSMLSAPPVAQFLQKNMNMALGPVLVLIGIVLLDIIPLGFSLDLAGEKTQKRLESLGMAGAFLLGALFALSFCPFSAALYFGSLFPLALKHESTFLLPAVYGLATGLPVLFFAVMIAFGANYLGRVYDRVASFERVARRITGAIFIAVGLYYSLVYIFGLYL